jgi:hypothetical protein
MQATHQAKNTKRECILVHAGEQLEEGDLYCDDCVGGAGTLKATPAYLDLWPWRLVMCRFIIGL